MAEYVSGATVLDMTVTVYENGEAKTMSARELMAEVLRATFTSDGYKVRRGLEEWQDAVHLALVKAEYVSGAGYLREDGKLADRWYWGEGLTEADTLIDRAVTYLAGA